MFKIHEEEKQANNRMIYLDIPIAIISLNTSDQTFW